MEVSDKVRIVRRARIFRSLSSRIGFLFLAALTVFTVLLGVTAYSVTRTWLEATAVSNLEALASLRKAAIEEQLSDYRGSHYAMSHPDLHGQVLGLLAADSSSRDAIRAEIEMEIRRKIAVDNGVVWVEILDLGRQVVAASFRDPHGEMPGTRSIGFDIGRDRLFISDPFPLGERVFLHLAGPLFDEQGDTMAVLIVRFDARDILSILGDYTGLGDTGETVLGARRGDQVHFLAPLRFDPNLSEIQPAPADGERAKPMIHATAGQSGTTRAPDYRGIRVVAAYRPIEHTGWGIVVKQDAAETLASVENLQTILAGGLVGLLFLAAVAIFPLVNNVMRPLRDLERATRQVAQGDLSARVPVATDDDVGRLAGSFNTMVDHLADAHLHLERRNQELSSFAYVVSHDLKAPLRAIDGLASWLADDLGETLEDDQLERLTLMRDRVLRMQALITGLLEFSRVGRVASDISSVDLRTLLRSVIVAVDPPSTVHISLPPELPVIETHELPLAQILRNLISNAVMHHPGPEGKVEVGVRKVDDTWHFEVRDDGDGVEERYQEQIFEVFQTLKPWDEGRITGVGLAIAKKIVEGHGGRIWIESDGKPGRGASFFFTWPGSVRHHEASL